MNKAMNEKSLIGSALMFRLNEEIAAILSEEPWQKTGRNARTLAKYSNFRIVLTALKQAAVLQEHQAKGCISVQVINGSIRVRLPERTIEISQGDLLVLDNAIPHSVEALEDSIFLITMSFNAETS